MCSGDPRKMKQLLKEKKKIFLKKHNFYLVKDLSLVSLELPNANKNLRKFSRLWRKTNSPFEGPPPLLGNQQKREGGRISIQCSPKISHHIHGNQANNSNTRTNIGNRGRTLSFKSSTTKQNFVKLPSVLQCKHSASICEGPVSNNNPIPLVPLARRLHSFFYKNQ